MKKTSRIEIAREIISNLKREMERARWTDSLRDGLSVDPRPPSRGFPFGRFEGSAVKSNRPSTKLLIMASDCLLQCREALRALIRRLLEKEIYELPIQKSIALVIYRHAVEVGTLDAISPAWHEFEATITDGVSVIQTFPDINRFEKHTQAILSSARVRWQTTQKVRLATSLRSTGPSTALRFAQDGSICGRAFGRESEISSCVARGRGWVYHRRRRRFIDCA